MGLVNSELLSFIAAAKAKGLPAAVCSTIPENLDAETRSFLVAEGVAPMQGIEECMTAIAAAAWHGARRAEIADARPAPLIAPQPDGTPRLLDEASAKQRLAATGKRVALKTPAEKVAWLERRLEEGGFRLLEGERGPWVQILQDTFLEVRRKKDGEEAGKLLQVQAVLFEGRLEVVDPERALATLRRGVGPGKALGLGLLSVAP